mmetsp:Transcript_109344/g.273900  ORF Transcript_109344/g.273900 Transcript_109344/m.273900 type:complete len:368 (+) Transcript_109344:76-1179(+)
MVFVALVVATSAENKENEVSQRNVNATSIQSAGSKAKKAVRGQKRQRSIGFNSVPRPLCSRKISARMLEESAARTRVTLRDLQAIVINLERRPDRMDGCGRRLEASCPDLRFARFAATDGKVTSIRTSDVATSWHTARNVVYQKQRSIRKGWDDLDSYQERRLPLSAGERGCASSHIRAWQHCLELAGGSERPLLVLEDDAAPTPEFSQSLTRALAALPSDASILYLGYSQAADWRREVSPDLVEAEYVWTTVGYIIWPAGARALLSQLPVTEPVDNWMAGLCADGQIKAYCIRPKIVLQADAWNVNSDVAHSDEHYWGPNSDIQHSDYAVQARGEIPPGRDESDVLAGSSIFGLGDSDSEDSAEGM